MKDNLTAHYHKLTPTERLSLAIQAQARGDDEESARLRETCPKVQYVAQTDLAYSKKYDTLVICALIHVGRLYRATTRWLLAQTDTTEATDARLSEINAIIGAWQDFCTEVMQDPAEILNQLGQAHAVHMTNSLKLAHMPTNDEMQAALFEDYLSAW